ncbi:hypothetical protein [Mycolicibacterium pulveris]|uniref:hypothetical protein n=1 Tax=Mycolicibacterium pulveris TaxID=36813 RepID=UPI003CF6BA4F
MTGLRMMLYAVLFCLAVAGCGLGGGPEVELTFDDPLEAKLSEVAERSEPVRLRDLTDFEWDEVHIFYEGDSREEVEDVVGAPVFRDKFYGSSGSLMVFEDKDSVVKALALTGEQVRADRPTWSADVLVVPYGLGYLHLATP